LGDSEFGMDRKLTVVTDGLIAWDSLQPAAAAYEIATWMPIAAASPAKRSAGSMP
jgi:hypothetical protein